MRIEIIPGPNNSYTALYFPDGTDRFFNSTIEPLLYKAKNQGSLNISRSGSGNPLLSDYVSGFSAFDIGIVGSIIDSFKALFGSDKKSQAKLNSGTGFEQMASYLVDGKYLYCKDDCGKAWRINMSQYGTISIINKPLEGQNQRFDCAILPADLLAVIPCQATKDKAKNIKSGSPGPTAPATSWATWLLLGGVGLLIFSSVFSSRKSHAAK